MSDSHERREVSEGEKEIAQPPVGMSQTGGAFMPGLARMDTSDVDIEHEAVDEGGSDDVIPIKLNEDGSVG